MLGSTPVQWTNPYRLQKLFYDVSTIQVIQTNSNLKTLEGSKKSPEEWDILEVLMDHSNSHLSYAAECYQEAEKSPKDPKETRINMPAAPAGQDRWTPYS